MKKFVGFIYGCISSATYGLIPLFALPVMARGMGSDSILAYRFLMTVLLLGAIMLFKKESFCVNVKQFFILAGLGTLFAFSSLFLFAGYQMMDAGIVATILFLYPVFVSVLMTFLFRERVSWLTNVAIAVAICGVALLCMGKGSGRVTGWGVFIVLLSALSYAFYIIVVNRSAVKQMSGVKLNFYAFSFGCLFFVAKALFSSGSIQMVPDALSWMNIFLLALVPTVISSVAMVRSIQRIGATFTAALGAMEPLTAVCVGILVFHEVLTGGQAFGLALIVASVTLIILSDAILERIHRYTPHLGRHHHPPLR